VIEERTLQNVNNDHRNAVAHVGFEGK